MRAVLQEHVFVYTCPQKCLRRRCSNVWRVRAGPHTDVSPKHRNTTVLRGIKSHENGSLHFPRVVWFMEPLDSSMKLCFFFQFFHFFIHWRTYIFKWVKRSPQSLCFAAASCVANNFRALLSGPMSRHCCKKSVSLASAQLTQLSLSMLNVVAAHLHAVLLCHCKNFSCNRADKNHTQCVDSFVY